MGTLLRGRAGLLVVIVGLLLLGAAFLLGRASGTEASAFTRTDQRRSSAPATDLLDSSSSERPAVNARATGAATVLDGGVAAAPARDLVDTFLHHVDLEALRTPNAPIEQITNAVQDEGRGIAMVAHQYPDIAADLHVEMRAKLCGSSATPAQRVAILRVMLAAPSIIDPVSVECALEREQAEGFVLWTALRVRQLGRLPPSPQTERWSSQGTDPRTVRLLSDERRPPASEGTPLLPIQ